MARLRFPFWLFFIASLLFVSELKSLDVEASHSESPKIQESAASTKKTEKSLGGKATPGSDFATANPGGDHIVSQKVLEIVKNPVNADLNKLPSDVIEKIAEGGVITPKSAAKALPVPENNSTEAATEQTSVAETAADATTTVTESSPESKLKNEESGPSDNTEKVTTDNTLP